MKRIQIAVICVLILVGGQTLPVCAQGLMDLMPSRDESARTVLSSKQLKTFVPKYLGSYKRGMVHYQDAADMGLSASYVETTYKRERERINVRINDMGGVGGLARMPVRGADSEYQKITVLGYPGLTSYDAVDGSGLLEIYVGGRFIVEIKGRRLSSHQSLYDIAESINCDGLAAYITQE